jgi:2-hydroxy-3-keto-5-methylthiopentenyl-1-phosphate phosphatase
MQDYSFIPSLGMTESEFWSFANDLGRREHMDSILAYMYAMVKISKDKNLPLLRQNLVDMGKNVELFNGVESWFERITKFGKTLGIEVEHYVISSGMKEIIEGTSIGKYFKSIFACEFLYDENGNGVWPKTDVNYTNKTQFVYRINKGVLDVANDYDLNRSMPDDSKRVPFCNMIYIGDGLSDVPCMKMMKAYGGHSIAVYQNKDSKVEDLFRRDRVDYIYPADYSQNSGLDITVKNLIKKISIDEVLYNEYNRQKRLMDEETN